MIEKTVYLDNEDELDETEHAILEQARELSLEEFILMQMWYLQHEDGLSCIVNDLRKDDEGLIYIDLFNSTNDETAMAVIGLDSEFIDLNSFAKNHDGYEQYHYYPFRDEATKCELVNWFYYAALETTVHPKLSAAKDRIIKALTGLLIVSYYHHTDK